MTNDKTNYYRVHNELVNKVILYLHSNCPGRYWSNPTGAVKTANGHFQRYGLKGSTDIIGHTYQGRAVYVEIKTGNSTLSKQQKAFKKIVEQHNCVHITVINEIDESLFKSIIKE